MYQVVYHVRSLLFSFIGHTDLVIGLFCLYSTCGNHGAVFVFLSLVCECLQVKGHVSFVCVCAAPSGTA